MKGKMNFTGYDEQQEKRRLDETRKREQAARKAGREENRKNKIPTFLVIRGGALNMLIVGLIGLAGTTLVTNYDYMEKSDVLPMMLLVVSIYLSLLGLGVAPAKICIIKDVLKFVNEQVDNYLQNKGSLNMRATKMRLMVLPYVVKQKPSIFDTFIEYPKSITDMKIAESILLAHLKSHPDDAQKILDTFNAESMPKRLYRRVKRCATR